MRLLTVVRRATSSEQHYVCLAIVLSAKDRSLIVSTKEELLQTYGKCFYNFLFYIFVSCLCQQNFNGGMFVNQMIVSTFLFLCAERA